jgi:hypothetical protein
VTDKEYWRALDLMFIEVNDAVQVFYTYLGMSELASEDRKLFQTLNRVLSSGVSKCTAFKQRFL